jgi:putative membrane protein
VDPYAWAWDAEMLVLVSLMTAAYAFSLRFFRPGRWRVASFLLAQALLLAVSITPVETLALNFLLSAHLLQNVVYAEWAPALIVLGLAPAAAARIARLPGVRTVSRPVIALPLWIGTYFVWHLPPLYDAALAHPATLLHLEHACYFAAGLVFWWPILQDEPQRLAYGQRAAYVFAAFVFASPIGLLLALLPDPVYEFYEAAPRVWGLSPLSDQQIAGVTMAVEQAVVFFAAFAFFFLLFMEEHEAPHHETT